MEMIHGSIDKIHWVNLPASEAFLCQYVRACSNRKKDMEIAKIVARYVGAHYIPRYEMATKLERVIYY
jgi:hypothetical protein